MVHQLTALSARAHDYGTWRSETNQLWDDVTGVLAEAARDTELTGAWMQ